MIIYYKKKYATMLLTFQKKKLYYNRQSQFYLVYPFSIFLGILNLVQLQMYSYLVGWRLKHSLLIMFLILLFYGQTAIINSDFDNYISNFGQNTIDVGNQVKILPSRNQDRTSFIQFKRKHNKKYGDTQEEVFRSLIFAKNREHINSHNSNPNRTYNMAINIFADMTSLQFNQIYSATIKSDQKIKNLTKKLLTYNTSQLHKNNNLNISQALQLKSHIQNQLQQRHKIHCSQNDSDDFEELKKISLDNKINYLGQRRSNIINALNEYYLKQSQGFVNQQLINMQSKVIDNIQNKINSTLNDKLKSAVNYETNSTTQDSINSTVNDKIGPLIQEKIIYYAPDKINYDKIDSTSQDSSNKINYNVSDKTKSYALNKGSSFQNKFVRNLQLLGSTYYTLNNMLPLRQTNLDPSTSTNLTSTPYTANTSNGFYSSNSIDWTVHAGKIRYQGICGACYTFATSDALGALYSIYKYGFFVSLSTQQVIDCSTNGLTYGCNGGFLEGSYAYMQTKGIQTDFNYPYTSSNSGIAGSCKKDGGSFKISSFKNIQEGNCKALVNQLNYGPISVGIAGYRLQFYSQGIFNDCNSYIDHAVVLISYKGGVGWKIKNSWGVDWGMKGFAWIADGNNCGICNMAVSAKL